MIDKNKLSTKSPDALDILAGQLIKGRRILLGLSQAEVGSAVGVSIQQIQKYEKGTNRITIGRLWCLAKILKAPIESFFEEEPKKEYMSSMREEEVPYEADYDICESFASEREIISLIKAYKKIEDVSVRKKVLDLLQSISKQDS